MKIEIDDQLVECMKYRLQAFYTECGIPFTDDSSVEDNIRKDINSSLEHVIREWLGMARVNMMCYPGKFSKIDPILEEAEQVYKGYTAEYGQRNLVWFQKPIKKNDKDSKTEETQE